MEIITEIADGVQCIQINRPKKKNALTIAMYADLAMALERAAGDPSIRAILIYGHPQVFSSGSDLEDFMNIPAAAEDRPVLGFLRAISTAAKPVVAAVTGPAVGIGTTLLLHCDLVYAGENASFHLPFVNLGLVPEAASSLLIPLAIGYQRAAELLLLGEPFSAAKARDYGIVTEVVADGEARNAAMRAAKKLAAKPPAALRLSKMLMKKGLAEAVTKQMKEEAEHFVKQLRSPEAAEAFKAFFEKRPADYSRFS